MNFITVGRFCVELVLVVASGVEDQSREAPTSKTITLEVAESIENVKAKMPN